MYFSECSRRACNEATRVVGFNASTIIISHDGQISESLSLGQVGQDGGGRDHSLRPIVSLKRRERVLCRPLLSNCKVVHGVVVGPVSTILPCVTHAKLR